MAVILRFFFERSAFLAYLVMGIVQIFVYIMFILSSRIQPQKKSKKLLISVAIIGLILTILYLSLPEVLCTPPDFPYTGICLFSRIFNSIIFVLPILICFGIPILLIGIWNKKQFGVILMISGILWLVAFVGYFFQEPILITIIEFLNVIGLTLALFSLPAAVLMIVHGAKNKDKYFIWAGSLFIVSFIAPYFLAGISI